jgi:hypothetical protein
MDRINELQLLMEETAQGLSRTPKLQGNWAGWIIYLLQAMDEAANTSGAKNDFEFTLAGLQDAINTRLREGRW